MNITKLYAQLNEGKVSKDFFMKTARAQFPQYVSPVTSFNDVVKILKGKRLISESMLEEAYEVHYSDGVRQAKKFNDPKSAIAFAKQLINTNKALQHVDVFKAGPNFHSTADANALVAWWGPGSYFDNMSKTDSSIGAKQIKEDVLNEAHKLTTAQIIDRLNPYHFKKGVEKELAKEKEITDEVYQRIKERVARKMQKNPLAYEDQVFANAKEIEKKDESLHIQELKKGNLVNKETAMKKAKGHTEAKSNTKVSTKENKKGNPKGVKHMTYNAKKAKGISQTMPATGKQKVLESITKEDVLTFLKKSLNEDNNTYTDYNAGRQVKLPEGEGTIVELMGGTATVEFKDGKRKDYQLNYVQHHTENPKKESEVSEEKIDESDAEYKLHRLVHDIQSHIETSSALDTGFKEWALNTIEEIDSNVIDENWNEVLLFLEDLDDAIQQVSSAEYQEVYAPMLKSAISHVEQLDSENEELDEAFDINDPVLMATRARKEKNLAQSIPTVSNNDFEIQKQIKDLKIQYAQALRDMEQEAEPEGGPIADDYADRLMDLQKQIKALQSKLSIHEEDINEAAYVPNNIAEFAKRKGISSTVKKVATWAEKAGKKIRGGTAIGKNYSTLILDLSYQDGAIRINTQDRDEPEIELYGEPVYDAKSFKEVLADYEKEGEIDETGAGVFTDKGKYLGGSPDPTKAQSMAKDITKDTGTKTTVKNL